MKKTKFLGTKAKSLKERIADLEKENEQLKKKINDDRKEAYLIAKEANQLLNDFEDKSTLFSEDIY